MAACQVEVDSGAFAYEDGILTHQKSWKEPFYRKIFSPSVIDGTFPQYEAVKVTENGIISVSFQRNMDKATGVISLDKNVGVLDGEWDVEGLVYTAFYTGLSEGKVYTALFSGFKDLEGNLIPDSKSILQGMTLFRMLRKELISMTYRDLSLRRNGVLTVLF